jgi:hypothetical protein
MKIEVTASAVITRAVGTGRANSLIAHLYSSAIQLARPLMNAPDGDVYTMGELPEWLEAAGMKAVKTIKAPQPSPLILATK